MPHSAPDKWVCAAWSEHLEWAWRSRVGSWQWDKRVGRRGPPWFRSSVTRDSRLSLWNFLEVTHVMKRWRKWHSDVHTKNAPLCVSNAGGWWPRPSPAPLVVWWWLGLVLRFLIWQRPLCLQSLKPGGGAGVGLWSLASPFWFLFRDGEFSSDLSLSTVSLKSQSTVVCAPPWCAFCRQFHKLGSKDKSVLDRPVPEVRTLGAGSVIAWGKYETHNPIQAFLGGTDWVVDRNSCCLCL